MLFPKLFLKMPHTKIKILLPVQDEHLLGHPQRHAPRRRLSAAPVVKTVVALVPIAVVEPTQLPRAQAQDLGRFKPMNLLADGPQNHFLYLHRPLHRGLGVDRPGDLPEGGLPQAACEKRIFHVLINRTYHVLTTLLPYFT